MAFKDKDSTNLEQLAKNMTVTGGIKRPADTNEKKEEEIQYSTMDLIAGICSSAMFVGGNNKNKDNVKSLLSDTKKSYLYSINSSLTTIVNYLKAQNGATNNLQSNVSKAILASLKDVISIADKAIMVKLGGDSIQQQNQESLIGADTLQQIITNSINSSNISNGDNDINVQISQDLKLLESAIKELISNNKSDDNKISDTAVKILIDIQNADSLTDLINALSLSNEIGEFDKLINSLGWLNQILEKISNLQVDSKYLINNIKSFKELLEYFDEHKNINAPDFSSFTGAIEGINALKDFSEKVKQSIIDETALKAFKNMIDELSGITLTDKNVESVNEIFVLLNNLNRSLPDKDETDKIKGNINKLTEIFTNDTESLKALYKAIQSAFDDASLTIENVKGLNEVLNSIITIVSFDKDINTDVIYELEQLLTDGGTVRNIITDIDAISGQITGNSSKALSILNSYISSLTAIGDIGLIAKINMMVNFEFFELYVNKKLPSLIKDINDNFKDLSSPQNLEVLESLEDYFSYIKNIGFVSVKDMVKMTLNIEFLRHFALKEIKKLITEISKEFGKMKDSKSSLSNISKLFANLMTIANFDTGKIDEQRKNLSNIRKLIFGDTIFGKRLGGLSNLRYSSISQIIEMINEFGKDLGDTTNNVNNIKKLMLLLNKNIISLKLDEKGAKTNIEILTLVHKKELPTLEKSIKYIKKIGEDYKDLDLTDFTNVLEKIKNATDKNSVKEVFDKLFVDKDATKRLLNTYAAFSNLKLLTKTLIWLGKIDESVIEKSLKPLIKLAEGLNIVINKFDFDEAKLKNAIKVLKQLELFLVKTSLILILSVLALSFFKVEDVFKYVLGMSVLLGGVAIILHLLGSKEFKDIENKLKTIQEITKMLAILSLSLAISTKIMQGVDWKAFIQLGVGVIVSLVICGAIVFLVNKFEDFIAKSIPVAKDLGILMFTLSISLALGAFIAQAVSPGQIATFGGLLALLIAAVSLPLLVLSKGSSILFQGGKDLGILILMVSMSLALGSLIAQLIPTEHIVKFGVILAGLIVALAVPLLALSIFGKAMIQGGKDLGLIMMYSTLSLLLGGLFIMIGGEKLVNAIKQFSDIFLGFICKLLIAYGFASLLGKGGMEHAKSLNKIILISALSLLIGGALFMIDGFKEAVNDFALTLGLFIVGISLALGIAAGLGKEGLKYAWQIALIVAITSLAMTLGPWFLKEHGVDYSDVFAFLGSSVLFIGAIGGLAYFAGKFKSDIGIGLVIVGAIGLLIFGMAWVFSKSYELLSPIKWLSLMGDLALAMLTLTAIGVFIGAIGALGMIVWPFLAVGAAIFAGIEMIIIGLAKTVSMVAKAINDLKKLGSIGDMGKLLKPFGDFIEAAISNLTVNPLKLAKLKLASSAMGSIGSMISSLAKGIKEYATLKVPMYDENGKEIGSRQLTPQDFEDAAIGVKTIITTVGGAIMDLMTDSSGKNAELMKELMQPAGLFGTSTKFGKLVKSLKSIGGLITTYAKAVQDYAQLKVPQIDKNGNIEEGKFRTLNPLDFAMAATNIGLIMSLMAQAVANTYKGNEKLFQGTWVSSSPISKVTKAMNNIGPMIGSLAKGIQDYAQLKVPQVDAQGNIIEGKFKLLSQTDFDTAKDNISKIITAIGEAIVNAVKNDTTGVFNFGSNSKASTAIKAITDVSGVIGSIADSIAAYATHEFPLLDYKDGKLTTSRRVHLYYKDIKEAANVIRYTIECLAVGILNAYNNKKLQSIWNAEEADSPVTKVSKAITSISKTIGTLNTEIEKLQKINKSLPTGDLTSLYNKLNDYIYGDDQKKKGIYHIVELLSNSNYSNATYVETIINNNEDLKEKFKNIGIILSLISNLSNDINKSINAIKQSKPIDTDSLNKLSSYINFINGDEAINFKGLYNLLAIIKVNDLKSGDVNVKEIKKYVWSLLSSIEYIVTTSNNFTEKIKSLKSPDIEHDKILVNSYVSYSSLIFKSIKDNENVPTKELSEQANNIAKNIIELLSNLTRIIIAVNPTILMLNQLNISEDTSNNLTLLESFISNVYNSISNLKNISKTENDNIMSMMFTFDLLIMKLQLFANIVNEQAKLSDNYNIFVNSINSIYNAISNIKDNSEFDNHVNSLKNYVETVNSIDISKVESLTSLIDSINSLGDKMGNLDSFTNVLANKLTIVLQNLAAKLDEAKKSIKDADTLHSKREKLIKGSVNTIKELMKQEMIVKIEQEEQSSPGGGTPGSPAGGGSTSPSGGANVTAEGGNDTTVNNTNINQGKSGGGNNNSSSVDIDALASAIANKMAAVLDARNIGS